MIGQALADFLNMKADEYNRPAFIAHDPISVPHRFTIKQDIEIAGLFAALFAWGNRKTIIEKANELMRRMDDAPHQFITQHKEADLKSLIGFKHRTFNDTDLLYVVSFLKHHYSSAPSLEEAFTKHMAPSDENVENALNGFNRYFFSLEHVPGRTVKHIAAPFKNSACKRLNMYLRWMVRRDKRGVDFGLWRAISPAQLVIPLDLHVQRVAVHFKLLSERTSGWKAAETLTCRLKELDAKDPCKYDFALFALGVLERF